MGRTPNPDHLPRPQTPFRISPLGLVAKNHAWYLIGERQNPTTRRDEPIRTYRLDRITSAADTNEAFTRPTNFNLCDYWAQTQRNFRASLPRYPIVLRVRDHAVPRFLPTAQVRPDSPGWSIVEADLQNAEEARAAVLAQGGDAVVLKPLELAKLVRDSAEKISRAHRTGQPDSR